MATAHHYLQHESLYLPAKSRETNLNKGSGEEPTSIEAESTLGLGSGLGCMFRVRVQNHEGIIEIRLNIGTSEQGRLQINATRGYGVGLGTHKL